MTLYGDNQRILRKFHTHDCHHNPGGLLVPGTHMHIPSVRVPLREYGSSYAYSVDLKFDTLGEAALEFCRMLYIPTEDIEDLVGGW